MVMDALKAHFMDDVSSRNDNCSMLKGELKNKSIHEIVLRIAYKNNALSSEELLELDESFKN